MIPIVAHGIMGTAYRQDVVVDEGVIEDGAINSLKDMRRMLSSQYGDDTPMSGWAIHPTIKGVWLSRIERSFDSNYAPAYVTVSFLIPEGKRLRLEALQLIEQSLLANHAKYMEQSVVLYKPDWNFLYALGRELEGLLIEDTNAISNHVHPTDDAAYWQGDIASLLHNMWDERFRNFYIVFCGNRILNANKKYTPIEDIELETTISDKQKDATITDTGNIEEMEPPRNGVEQNNATVESSHNEEIVVEEIISDDEQKDVLRDKDIDKGGNYGNNGNNTHNDDKPNTRQNGTKNSSRSLVVSIGIIIVGIILVIISIYKEESRNQIYYDDIIDTAEVEAVDDDDDIIDTAEVVAVDDDMQDEWDWGEESVVEANVETPYNTKNDERVGDNQPTSNQKSFKDNNSVCNSKIIINNPRKLFLCLTWDNVKDGGKQFFEKYELSKMSKNLEDRVHVIITRANIMGKEAYIRAYREAEHDIYDKEPGRDGLYYLEREIGL